ncbi:uncharacterized protein LOC111402643 [Olea europaea var. sylvestris]|uniref:uncharacterized protein LOC111402643 n=1 Tax=Olea europaea var. sylvestris TaxID=158386 RepID=UPI000C1D5DCF|nr:uncharacterized protein LOC111402643 [Olea europaea var. sylvestris]
MSLPNFDALKDMHDSVNDLLHSPMTKQKIAYRGEEKWVHEVSEASLKMVDACGATKDILLLVKDHLQELQSTFRRISVNETTVVGNQFAAYHHHRKTLKKAILKRLQSLKGMKNKNIAAPIGATAADHCSLVVVVNVLKEVKATTMSIVESLNSLISMPKPNRKSNKEAFKFKLTRVNSLSLWEKCDISTIQTAIKRLEAVEIITENLEAELECMFRRLIRTRASLLNILTN